MANKKTPIASIIALSTVGLFFAILLFSSWGLFNTFLSQDARAAGFGWKIAGLVPLLAAAYLIYLAVKGRITFGGGYGFLLLILLALSISANCGFKFTGGDIKQHVTPFDMSGRVVDKEVLYEYYDDYYHFSTDTALKNYVEKYGELPGRNNQNHYIRSGQVPKSTAPRADENFPWHSGAYE